jgi:hypothetical protein
MTTVTKLIETNEIRIVSGEGEVGTTEIYNGKRSLRAIKMRLTKERYGGDRWAYAKVFSHTNNIGDKFDDIYVDVFLDVETGDYC